jgi:hypothetical protein
MEYLMGHLFILHHHQYMALELHLLGQLLSTSTVMILMEHLVNSAVQNLRIYQDTQLARLLLHGAAAFFGQQDGYVGCHVSWMDVKM